MALISLVRAWARSRCAWNTKKLIWIPAANFFSSAASRCSARSRAALALSTRFWLVCTWRAASRTCVPICISRFLSCVCACEYCRRARARFVSCVLAPSGYDIVTPTVHVGNALEKTSPRTDP
jgi:hypothetical protein